MLSPALARTMSEAAVRAQYREWAGWFGYTLQYHETDSRKSARGWPDDVLCHPERGRAVVIEAKAEDGRLRPPIIVDGRYHPGQKEWLIGLDRAGWEVYLIRPSDLGLICRVLQHDPLSAEERRRRLEALPDTAPEVYFTRNGLRMKVPRGRGTRRRPA